METQSIQELIKTYNYSENLADKILSLNFAATTNLGSNQTSKNSNYSAFIQFDPVNVALALGWDPEDVSPSETSVRIVSLINSLESVFSIPCLPTSLVPIYRKYTSFYVHINRYMRKELKWIELLAFTQEEPETLQHIIKEFCEAVASVPKSPAVGRPPILLFRGVCERPSWEVGQIVTFSHPLSSSLFRCMAEKYMTDRRKYPSMRIDRYTKDACLYKIYVVKPWPMVFIPFTHVNGYGKIGGLNEVLLAPNSQFVVKSIDNNVYTLNNDF
jgi:hypothetical protein